MNRPDVKTVLYGFVATGVVLSYSYIGNQEHINLENINPPVKDCAYVPEDYDYNSYYLMVSEESRIREQIEILHTFVSNLIENSEELDPNFVNTVNNHFWDLA